VALPADCCETLHVYSAQRWLRTCETDWTSLIAPKLALLLGVLQRRVQACPRGKPKAGLVTDIIDAAASGAAGSVDHMNAW
jgi:hypothetical protein